MHSVFMHAYLLYMIEIPTRPQNTSTPLCRAEEPWNIKYTPNRLSRHMHKTNHAFLHQRGQKYSRLRCLLRVKGLVICFYLGWSGRILQFRQKIIKVGSKSWLLTCSSNITLSLPSYTGSALKRKLNYCNIYLSLLYFWTWL